MRRFLSLLRISPQNRYTRNRLFRLLGSNKFGKPADAGKKRLANDSYCDAKQQTQPIDLLPPSALRIAEANEFPFPNGFGNAKFYLPEMKRVPKDDLTVASVVSSVSIK